MKKNVLIVFVLSFFGLLLLSGCQKEKITVSGELNGHSYVDLGLPSGTLWATCNVGASNPKEEGDHYSWGEIRTKESYCWDNYKYGVETYSNGYYYCKVNKYCSSPSYGVDGYTDNLTRLLASDDVASVLWGEGWRMPTKNEFSELFSECSWSHIKYRGKEGLLFVGINGNSLFLPTISYGEHDCHLGYEIYWSSSLDIDIPSYAFGVQAMEEYSWRETSLPRNGGYSVRPVTSSRKDERLSDFVK